MNSIETHTHSRKTVDKAERRRKSEIRRRNRNKINRRSTRAEGLGPILLAAGLAFISATSIEQNSGPNVLHPIDNKTANTIEVNADGISNLKPGEVRIINGNGITSGDIQMGIPQYVQRVINGLRSRGKQVEVECRGTAYDTINGPDYSLNIQSPEIVTFKTSTSSEGKIIDKQTNNVLTFGTNSAFSGFIIDTTIGIKNHKGEFTPVSSFTSSFND